MRRLLFSQPLLVQGVVPHMARAYPGLLLRNELRFLHAACTSPAR